MINLTAVIRCNPGSADVVLNALIAVGDFVKAHEPDTLGFRVIRAADDPDLLITQERFKDRAAMETHNDGAGSKTFFAAANGLLADVTIHIGEEVFAVQAPDPASA